jgi:hypothetical protein
LATPPECLVLGGDKDAREFRDNLAREMTFVDISMAQELAREWLEKHGE